MFDKHLKNTCAKFVAFIQRVTIFLLSHRTICVLHFGEELFATVGAAKHSYDSLNMRNVFKKIPRREGDVAEEG